MKTVLRRIGRVGDYLPLTGGTLTGDLTLGTNDLIFTNTLLREDGATDVGVYDAAGLNYRSLAVDDISLIGSLLFTTSSEDIRAPNIDAAFVGIYARDTGVGLIEVARITGAATPSFDLVSGRLTGTLNANNNGIGSCNSLGITDGGSINVWNADNSNLRFTGRDNGVGLVEVARTQSAPDPYFGIGVDGSVLKGTGGGLLGFFAATPVGQQLKANHNNWAAVGDVVAALVNLGLLDQV